MLTWIVVLSLVTYRCTRFIIDDALIDAQRCWVQKKIAGRQGSEVGPPRGSFPICGKLIYVVPTAAWRAKLLELLDCPYCVSVWVALGSVMSARLAGPGVPQPFWVWLATAGGTMFWWKLIED